MTVNGLDVGETVEYACVTGYEQTAGDLVLTCELGPQWSGTQPTCSSNHFIIYLLLQFQDFNCINVFEKFFKE